jgi:hypothetical protein
MDLHQNARLTFRSRRPTLPRCANCGSLAATFFSDGSYRVYGRVPKRYSCRTKRQNDLWGRLWVQLFSDKCPEAAVDTKIAMRGISPRHLPFRGSVFFHSGMNGARQKTQIGKTAA